MSLTDFGAWLDQQLAERNMRPADLAKRANLDQALISRFRHGKTRPTPESLIAIARALKLPYEIVYQKAGLLPPEPERTAILRQIEFVASELPEEEQINILEYARLRQRLAEERGKYDASKRTPPAAPKP